MELKKLDAFITQALAHPTLFISRIRLTGYCSVEGGAARNEALSSERVEGFYRYLHEHYPRLSRYPCDRAWVGEDWDGLFERVRVSSIFEREEVLTIIRAVREYDTRELLLRELNGGQPWLFIERKFFPQLRRVELRIEYGEAQQTAALPHTPTASPRPSPKERGKDHAVSISIPLSFGEGRGEAASSRAVGRPLFALKSNLLFDLALTPNIEAEVPLGRRWSVVGEFQHGWWLKKDNTFCWQLETLGLEGRYWLGDRGRRVLTGWFAGAFAGIGVYDFQLKRDKGVQGDFYISAGLSGGYAMQFGCSPWGMEFSLGAGYLTTEYARYRIYQNKLVRHGALMRFSGIVPLKAKISLVYMFHHRKKKGGAN